MILVGLWFSNDANKLPKIQEKYKSKNGVN